MLNEHLIRYLIQFHAVRDYFECHEILEEYWKAHPEDQHSHLYVALIQVAVGQYHERRGNRAGAEKMYESSIRKLKLSSLTPLGISSEDLLEQLDERLQATTLGLPFEDIDMWITDNELLVTCIKQAEDVGLEWGAPSPKLDDSLIHRHKLRDRSAVIAERAAALKIREAKRNSQDAEL